MSRKRNVMRAGRRILVLGLISAGAMMACKEKSGDKKASESRGKHESTRAVAVKTYPEIEALRNSIPGGQVLLPDDPAFADGIGWWEPDYAQNEQGWIVTSWTKGEYQVLDWKGPEKPGEYALEIEMWRHNPFPTEKLSMDYLLPGAAEKVTMDVPLGRVTIAGKVQVAEPKQKLHMEMRIPSFIPKDHIPGSNDPRDLGFLFTRLTLTPVTAPAAADAASATN